jgi:hypothetical protein
MIAGDYPTPTALIINNLPIITKQYIQLPVRHEELLGQQDASPGLSQGNKHSLATGPKHKPSEPSSAEFRVSYIGRMRDVGNRQTTVPTLHAAPPHKYLFGILKKTTKSRGTALPERCVRVIFNARMFVLQNEDMESVHLITTNTFYHYGHHMRNCSVTWVGCGGAELYGLSLSLSIQTSAKY